MRRLMWICIGYSSALLAAHYILPEETLLWFALGCAVFALAALLIRGKSLIPFVFLISAAFGFVWTWGHSTLFISPAEKLIGRTLEIDARVTDYPVINEDYSSVELKLREDWTGNTRLIVYDYNGAFGELRPGDTLRLELRFISARVRSNMESDYYLSSGIYLRAYLEGEYRVTGRWANSWLHAPQYLAHTLKEHILRLFPEDTAPLMKALLTGDKSEFYDDDALYCAMKTAGLSHIIAVSGMHVSFILGLLRIFTGRRRASAFLGIPLIWFFAAMSGLSPSVIRASLMMTLLLSAPLLRRENDAPTSLSAALLLLTLINPQAIGSISLQLSFAAMAGIILVTPHIYSSMGRLFKDVKGLFAAILRYLSALISASVGAIVFTTPIAALHFGYVPIYSLLSNLLCLWAMSTAFSAGYITCIVGALYFPVGSALAWVIAWLPRYTIVVVKLIASLPFAQLSTHNFYVALWLIFAYAVLILPLLFRKGKAYRPLVPICCCLCGFLLLTVLVQQRGYDGLEISAVDVGQGQCIIAAEGDCTVMVDCGGKSGTINAGDTAADYLFSTGRDSIDLLILTHLHADHANGVVRLINRVDVSCLALPEDCENTEFRDSILDLCYDKGIEVHVISRDTMIRLGAMELEVYAPIGSEDINERGLIIRGRSGDFDFLVTGDAGDGTEKLLLSFCDLSDTELLVAGHHGSGYSCCSQLLDAAEPEYVLISVGVNSYGHPSEELLLRLFQRDIEFYRTDLNGTITVRAGK